MKMYQILLLIAEKWLNILNVLLDKQFILIHLIFKKCITFIQHRWSVQKSTSKLSIFPLDPIYIIII